MKCLKIIAVALLACGAALGADVTFNLVDFLGTTQTLQRKTAEVAPLSTVRGSGENVVLSERRLFSTGTNGTFTATNINEGLYRVRVFGGSYTSVFRILVPATNGTLIASDLLHSGALGALHTEEGRPLLLE